MLETWQKEFMEEYRKLLPNWNYDKLRDMWLKECTAISEMSLQENWLMITKTQILLCCETISYREFKGVATCERNQPIKVEEVRIKGDRYLSITFDESKLQLNQTKQQLLDKIMEDLAVIFETQTSKEVIDQCNHYIEKLVFGEGKLGL